MGGGIITSSNLMGDVRCLTVSPHRAWQCSCGPCPARGLELPATLIKRNINFSLSQIFNQSAGEEQDLRGVCQNNSSMRRLLINAHA